MDKWLLILGFIGQAVFGLRFIVQWIYSEKKKESFIPVVFWYLSIIGGVLLLSYVIIRKDPVLVVGQSMGLIVYIRNLVLINRKKRRM